MHKHVRRLIPVVLLPVALAFSSVSSAESLTGYAVEVLNGMSGTAYNYDTTLVGISSTPTGPVVRYLFTADRTYAEMLAAARIHQTLISVSNRDGTATLTGVYFNR